ncbi:MAG: ribonuclease H-like YkuK family protein [Candidatus Anstonellales archaeon]
MEGKWFYGDKVITEQDVIRFIDSKNKLFCGNCKTIVGTDSHYMKHHVKFVTVVCVYNIGYGGDFCWLSYYLPKEQFTNISYVKEKTKYNNRLRIFHEVSKSIEVADWIYDNTGVISDIHIDVSKQGKANFTSSVAAEVVSYASSFGFTAFLKPDSFVASVIADRYTK